MVISHTPNRKVLSEIFTISNQSKVFSGAAPGSPLTEFKSINLLITLKLNQYKLKVPG
jgi:hypothetical protein